MVQTEVDDGAGNTGWARWSGQQIYVDGDEEEKRKWEKVVGRQNVNHDPTLFVPGSRR